MDRKLQDMQADPTKVTAMPHAATDSMLNLSGISTFFAELSWHTIQIMPNMPLLITEGQS